MSYNSYVDPREREDIRAHQGENVWVVLNHIRAEKREAFEYFVNSILMPAVAHVHPGVYNKIRILNPTRLNQDGTYTYVFLMDPVVPGGVYEFNAILHEYYKSELADEYIKIWYEALSAPQVEYEMVQSAE